MKKIMHKLVLCKWFFQLLFFLFIGTAITSQTAYAKFVIDDFESGGPIHLYVDQYKAYDDSIQYGLPVPSGRREIAILNNFNPNGTVTKLDLVNTSGDDGICVSGSKKTTDAGSVAVMHYRDGYDGMSLDITSLGDRFYVTVNNDPGADIRMGISLQDQDSSMGGGPFTTNLNGSGYYEFPFSVYDNYPTIDLTQISGFGLQISFLGSEQEIAITEWGIIPEPATVSLLALGGLALLRRRK